MNVPLRELEGEIRTVRVGDFRYRLALFRFEGRQYGVPFSDAPFHEHPKAGKLWKRVSGSTVDDLTLSPSYWVKEPPEYRIHVHVTKGVVTGLPDRR